MKNTLLLLVICLCFSCGKDDESSTSNDHCLDSYSTVFLPAGCDDGSVTSPYWCRIDYVGDFALEEDSKSFLPFYCFEENDLIEYVNDAGDDIEFEVESKLYSKASFTKTAQILCNVDSIKNIGLCFDTESARVKIKSDVAGLDFFIRLQTELDRDVKEKDDTRIGDFIEVTQNQIVDSMYRGTIIFKIVVNPRSLTNTSTINQLFYDEIEIAGKKFTEVFSYDQSNFNDNFVQIFYNKAFGIVGFTDENGVQWRLKN